MVPLQASGLSIVGRLAVYYLNNLYKNFLSDTSHILIRMSQSGVQAKSATVPVQEVLFLKHYPSVRMVLVGAVYSRNVESLQLCLMCWNDKLTRMISFQLLEDAFSPLKSDFKFCL